MFTPGTKIKYEWHTKEIISTELGPSGPEKFMEDFFNELGEQGLFVINVVETNRPSSIVVKTPNGEGRVPYYILKVMTAKAVTDEDAS